jgi:hypothetical protein
MLRLALVVLTLVLSVAPSIGPASAQRFPLARPTAEPPSNPEALYAWCLGHVFRRYGTRIPNVSATPKGPIFRIDQQYAHQAADACVRSKGSMFRSKAAPRRNGQKT